MNLNELRQNYTKNGLLEKDCPNEPLELFTKWFQEALDSKIPEPNAMTFSTVTPKSTPNARIVLLKEIANQEFIFFTNYLSAKANEIEKNINGSLLFFWVELERQVRISGRVNRISQAKSEEYFRTRPRESQIGAWASHQSKVIANREELEEKFSELKEQFADKEIPMPEFWGGYALTPSSIEFWQGRPSRLHDRIFYSKKLGTDWKRERLSP